MQSVEKLVSNNCFEVSIEEKVLSFSKVSGFKQKIEYDTIVEGGISENIHIIQKTSSQPETIFFEKGIAYNEYDSKFLPVGKHFDEVAIRIIKNGIVVKEYCLNDVVVVERSLGELDAMSSNILIQKFELAYTNMTESIYNSTDVQKQLEKQNKERLEKVTHKSNKSDSAIKKEKEEYIKKQEAYKDKRKQQLQQTQEKKDEKQTSQRKAEQEIRKKEEERIREREEIIAKRKKRREIEAKKKQGQKRKKEEIEKQQANSEKNAAEPEDLFSLF